ncbi:MAG TPA: hypothetical protein VFE47_01565 [Tepidisphaeraceae bacterium]|jgi:hypothetical protein|nr:hypothetical protein [Tepidisphaeraceae bacterium]
MRTITCGVVILNLTLLGIVSQIEAAPPTPEEKSAFNWFDGMGFPKIQGTQWVRVATGQWSQSGNKPRENGYVDGFLLSVTGDRFTVFTTEASTVTFVKTGKAVSDYERVDYEPRNLEQDAKLKLDALRNPPDDAQDRSMRRFGSRLPEQAEVFILARACAANGLDDLAHDLCGQAEAMGGPGNGGNEIPFRKRISDDFAYAAIWKAFVDFEDPKISRAQLLKTFQEFVAHFPDGEFTARAKEAAGILQEMVKEDESHAKATTRPAGQMPMGDRVAELIFELRDQNGHQWSQPGACDIFNDDRGEKSPAAQLVAIGFDAVPQLIAAMDDQRFTRCVGYHRDFYFSHFVLRAGDCAETILSEIACRPFYISESTSGAMLKDGKADNAKHQAQQWWEQVQKKGEKQVLVEAVASGDDTTAAQAERLVKKYPDAALDAIAQGVEKTKSDWLGVRLVEASGELKGDSALPFLTHQLTNGASIDVRVAAATILRARGKSIATGEMINEWIKRSKAVEGRDTIAPESLLEFLTSSNDLAAIHALKDQIGVWPVSSRLAIVESLGRSENFMAVSSGSGPNLSAAVAVKRSQATLDAIEDLLIAELDDTEERVGMSGSIGDDSFSDPRVCDMAAHSLAARWDKLYTFKWSLPLPERDRQRLAIQNTWRKRHNLPPLQLRQSRKIDPVAAEKIDPLLQLLAAPAGDVREKAAADIEALGLGTLGAVRKAIATLPASDPRKAALDLLARRLSCHVEQITILPEQFHPEGDLKVAIDALKEKALTDESFIGVAIAFAKNQPAGVRGMRLQATRGDDLTGFEIRVQMLPGKFDTKSQWYTDERVIAGSDALYESSGGSSFEYRTTRDGWDNLAGPLTKALGSPPEMALEVTAALEHH